MDWAKKKIGKEEGLGRSEPSTVWETARIGQTRSLSDFYLKVKQITGKSPFQLDIQLKGGDQLIKIESR